MKQSKPPQFSPDCLRRTVRFGSFEVFYYRRQFEQVRELADYVIQYHYPHLIEVSDKYLQFLREVVNRTARLIAQWQAVGFAHGVMNTDNMSVIGATIDYGPFGFLDEYEPEFICNHSDYNGRYAFDQQPAVALWNLSRLAQTLITLIERDDAVAALNEFQTVFIQTSEKLMNEKLGLATQDSNDAELVADLLEILAANKVDYTIFFRRLADFKIAADKKIEPLSGMFIDPASFDRWAQQYRARLFAENSLDAERSERIKRVNPKYILRNHLAQQAIEHAQSGDYGEVNRLLEVLQNPFDEQIEAERFAAPPLAGSKRIAVSCSS